jgi:hypothetical protein
MEANTTVLWGLVHGEVRDAKGDVLRRGEVIPVSVAAARCSQVRARVWVGLGRRGREGGEEGGRGMKDKSPPTVSRVSFTVLASRRSSPTQSPTCRTRMS